MRRVFGLSPLIYSLFIICLSTSSELQAQDANATTTLRLQQRQLEQRILQLLAGQSSDALAPQNMPALLEQLPRAQRLQLLQALQLHHALSRALFAEQIASLPHSTAEQEARLKQVVGYNAILASLEEQQLQKTLQTEQVLEASVLPTNETSVALNVALVVPAALVMSKTLETIAIRNEVVRTAPLRQQLLAAMKKNQVNVAKLAMPPIMVDTPAWQAQLQQALASLSVPRLSAVQEMKAAIIRQQSVKDKLEPAWMRLAESLQEQTLPNELRQRFTAQMTALRPDIAAKDLAAFDYYCQRTQALLVAPSTDAAIAALQQWRVELRLQHEAMQTALHSLQGMEISLVLPQTTLLENLVKIRAVSYELPKVSANLKGLQQIESLARLAQSTARQMRPTGWRNAIRTILNPEMPPRSAIGIGLGTAAALIAGAVLVNEWLDDDAELYESGLPNDFIGSLENQRRSYLQLARLDMDDMPQIKQIDAQLHLAAQDLSASSLQPPALFDPAAVLQTILQ